MIIGIDASKAAVKNRTGVENLVYELILNLAKIDHENIYYLYTNAPLPKELRHQLNFIEKLDQKKRFWNSWFLPRIVGANKCDVYLQPTDKIPSTAPKNSIAIVHDLAWKYFPTAYSTFDNMRQRQAINNYLHRARKLICVSKSTRDDLVKYFPKTKSKAFVVPLGYDKNIFHPFSSPRDLLKIDSPYILSIGRLEERKNTARLINAFIILKKEKEIEHKLVLIGSPGYNFDIIYRLINDAGHYAKDIVLPGFIEHTKLAEVIARADVFAFPTLYEGFGLPALEAMACAVPTVTSNTSSLPEIVGDGAILCDPEDENDIADKIYQFISNKNIREKYSAAALKQAEMFSWEKTARETLNIIEEVEK
jgi:glycosyltransferase involved in cell wall biosynthesis